MINIMDGDKMELTERQKEIIEIVKDHEPIKSKDIAEKIGINRATIRPDYERRSMFRTEIGGAPSGQWRIQD